MNTFRAIVLSSLVAGFVVGAIVTVIQQFGTVPLILRAEVFEKAAEHHRHDAASDTPQGAIAGHSHAEHQHDAGAWEPQDGWERNGYTAAANILTAIGFAMLLAAIFALRNGNAGSASWHEGMIWGLAGFAVFTLAPGLGLPPELPGVPAAPLLSRQIWWALAAASTAGGLGLIFLRRSMPASIAGLILVLLPCVIGAPELEQVETNIPTSLSHQFVVAVTLTSLVFWFMLGGVTRVAFAYFDRDKPGAYPSR
jgi:cobalt transporter subunit CbtA